MKPAAAFTIGLWTGALVVVMAGAGRFACQRAAPESTPESPATVARQQSDRRRLDQENAQLTAETQRLRQTLAELKSQPVLPVPTDDLPRRIPFRRADVELAPSPTNLLAAVRWLGATIEVNPHGAAGGRSLIADELINPELVLAAAEGLAQPGLVETAAGKTDFAARMRLLDSLIQAVEDAALGEQLAKLREALLAQWAEAGGSQPGD